MVWSNKRGDSNKRRLVTILPTLIRLQWLCILDGVLFTHRLLVYVCQAQMDPTPNSEGAEGARNRRHMVWFVRWLVRKTSKNTLIYQVKMVQNQFGKPLLILFPISFSYFVFLFCLGLIWGFKAVCQARQTSMGDPDRLLRVMSGFSRKVPKKGSRDKS